MASSQDFGTLAHLPSADLYSWQHLGMDIVLFSMLATFFAFLTIYRFLSFFVRSMGGNYVPPPKNAPVVQKVEKNE